MMDKVNTAPAMEPEKVDLQEVMDNLQDLPEREQFKIKYIIQGAALVSNETAADRHAG